VRTRAESAGRSAAIAVLVLLIAVLAYQTWLRFSEALDFNIYLVAARAFWKGENPYAIGTAAPFIYPLFLCFVLWPLLHIPLGLAAVVWFVLSLLALATAAGLTLRISGPINVNRAVVAAAIVFVLLAEVLQNNFRNGQVNFLVLAATLGFAWCWSRGRRTLASGWLAVAIAVKVTPAIFLIFLARRRDWRTLLTTIAMTMVLTMALPAAVAGPRIFDDYREYAREFVGDRVTSASGIIIERRPFSVVGALHRFTDISWPFDAVMVGLGVLLISALVIDRGQWTTGQGTTALVCFYLVTMLLATPMSEVHHLAFVRPGLLWLTYRALGGELSRGRMAALAFAIAALMLRRHFHIAGFIGVASAWVLLAVEVRSAPAGPGVISSNSQL
jgi:alpha-1,2-mannosyltransferase